MISNMTEIIVIIVFPMIEERSQPMAMRTAKHCSAKTPKELPFSHCFSQVHSGPQG